MASAFTAAGATGDQSKYAALTMDRYITGLVTQRSALRDADVPYLQAKFYSAGRFDSLWDGLNVEISVRSTLVRRPGNSVYNSQTFPPIGRFYDFRTVVDGQDVVHVMADTAAMVYDATGPSTKLKVWAKSAGAGRTCFQSVGNTLYFSNQIDNKKWMLSAKAWAPKKTFSPGDFIVDPNNNIQLVPQQKVSSISSVTVDTDVVTVLLQGPDVFAPGSSVSMSGLTSATFLNGQTLTPTTATIANGFQASFAAPDYPLTIDTGSATSGGGAGATGQSAPAWSKTTGTVTIDAGVQWICWGSAVQNWAIAAPTTAPSVVQTNLSGSAFPAWTASTIYSTSLSVVDENGNVQKLTSGGITGSAEPVWNTAVGGSTTDGTAVWTNTGSKAWIAGATHVLGDIVQATYTYYVTVYNENNNDAGYYNGGNYPQQGQPTTSQYPVTETDFFLCTTAGVSGTSTPGWTAGAGLTTADGGVVWTNQGTGSSWTAAIGPGATISLAKRIVDSNGNFQTISTSGKSGATAPTWSMASGETTTDNTAVWTEAGSYSAGATAACYYGFAGKCSIDDTTTTLSPLSVPIIRSANKIVTLQGMCFTDPQCDTIVIYRTDEGGSILQELDEIPQPAGNTWTYQDSSPDSALTIELQAARNFVNDPPPTGITALSYHLGRVWAAVGNLLYWCSGPDSPVGNGLNAWSPSNVFTYPDTLKRMEPVTVTNGALFAFSVSDLYAVFGTGTASNPFYTTIYGKGIGLLNYDALDIIGSTIHLLSTARKQISLDPSAGYVETGAPIGDQLKVVTTGGIDQALYDPATAYVTWHEAESGDTGLYVSDGAVGWFRYSPVSMPETGFLWSPRAAIEGGTSAVQSIETQPGLKSLLIGPRISGPILQRDLTVNADNSVPYADTYATLGSMQLCQPYEVCEVAGVVLDSIRTGTAPTIGILYGEINPTVEVPFDLYERTGQDPPILEPSATLFNDRFVTLQNGNPTLCRHMQLLIQWTSEDAASELLTHTVYGKRMTERKQQ